ncbi:MAG: hypothetical protein LBI60_05930 [Bacteroidales bacterium]|nr:hypothetical protein [Bacteroidales bacterium]
MKIFNPNKERIKNKRILNCQRFRYIRGNALRWRKFATYAGDAPSLKLDASSLLLVQVANFRQAMGTSLSS